MKHLKMCELGNCLLNMTYTTRDNVGIEWEGGLQSVKTHLFIETSKISLFSSHIHHCRVSYSKWSMWCMHSGARLSEGAAVMVQQIDF